ncbi:MAG: GCN5-related N-acetyltransferase [Marmoricola sp.]|nr:GCN5-related N-acetyltransferase [Marmoricola sp.]
MEVDTSPVALRPMTREDAPAVVELLAASEAVDHTEEHVGLEDVLDDLANPMTDPARDWLLAERDGRLVGHARLLPRSPADGEQSVGVDGTVHPSARRTGVGALLLDRLLERARGHVAERAAATGVPLVPVVTVTAPDDLPDLEALLARRGLRPDRWSFGMEVDLTRWEADLVPARPGVPEGYVVQSWAGVDPEEVRAAHNRAFSGFPGWTPWDAQMWRTWVTEHHADRPALSLLARAADGHVAAYVRASEFPAVEEATGRREVYLAVVGTDPDHRGRGLSTALLVRVLGTAGDQGFARAALDVDTHNPSGALGIYERVGFEVVRRWTTYRQG